MASSSFPLRQSSNLKKQSNSTLTLLNDTEEDDLGPLPLRRTNAKDVMSILSEEFPTPQDLEGSSSSSEGDLVSASTSDLSLTVSPSNIGVNQVPFSISDTEIGKFGAATHLDPNLVKKWLSKDQAVKEEASTEILNLIETRQLNPHLTFCSLQISGQPESWSLLRMAVVGCRLRLLQELTQTYRVSVCSNTHAGSSGSIMKLAFSQHRRGENVRRSLLLLLLDALRIQLRLDAIPLASPDRLDAVDFVLFPYRMLFDDVKHIDLSSMNLLEIPLAIFYLFPKLTRLDLSHNQLSYIHPAIQNLQHLTELNLSKNPHLDRLPPQLCQLANISKFGIFRCPLKFHRDLRKRFDFFQAENVPPSKATISQLFQSIPATFHHRRIRLMVLGEKGVGRSTLINAIVESHKPKFKQSNSNTAFVVRSLYDVQAVSDTEANSDLRLLKWIKDDLTIQVWDFGESDSISKNPLLNFTLRASAIYIIVFNVAQDMTHNRIDAWLQLVKSVSTHSQPAQVLLVGTHTDLLIDQPTLTIKDQLEQLRATIGNIFPRRIFPGLQGIHFITHRGGKSFPRDLKELRKHIVQLAANHNFLTHDVPVEYFSLELAIRAQRLLRRAADSPPLIHTSQLVNLIKSQGILDPMAISSAIGYLEDIGLVFLFDAASTGNKSSFQFHHPASTVVLDIPWLASRLRLITSLMSRDCTVDPIFYHDLTEQWVQVEPKLRIIALSLLQQFGMALPLPPTDRNRERSLISFLLRSVRPSLLSERWPAVRPPHIPHEWRRVYRFRFAPMGLFSRLLVWMHQVPDLRVIPECCWGSGLLLERQHDGQLSLITLQNFSLDIRVRSAPTPSIHSSSSNFGLSSSSSSSAYSSSSSSFSFSSASIGSNVAMGLLEQLVDLVEQILESYFPQLINSVQRSLACVHCLQHYSILSSIYYFPLEFCLQALQRHERIVHCCGMKTRPVMIESMAPDLIFADMPLIHADQLEIQHVLGRGGFGVVYKAMLRQLDSIESDIPVAVKEMAHDESEIPFDLISKFNEFRREASIHSKLLNPHLVRLYGICLHPRLRMVLEFVDSGDLYHLIHSKSLHDDDFPIAQRLQIAADVAAGMSYLHGLTPPIVHCDLRSPNVFLTRESRPVWRAKVADFGLSRQVFQVANAALQSWQWLPPEVIQHGEFTELCDVYSFAIVCYEIFTRIFPFDRDQGPYTLGNGQLDLLAMKTAVVERQLRPSLPVDLVLSPRLFQLMQKAWAAVPSERPSFPQILEEILAIATEDLNCSLFPVSTAPLQLVDDPFLLTSSAPSSSGEGVPPPGSPSSFFNSLNSSSFVGAEASSEDTLVSLEPQRIPLPASPLALCMALDHCLLVGLSNGDLLRINPDDESILQTIHLNVGRIYEIQVISPGYWLAAEHGVLMLNQEYQTVGTVSPPGSQFRALAQSFHGSAETMEALAAHSLSEFESPRGTNIDAIIWAASPSNSTLALIDAIRLQLIHVVRFPIEFSPTALLHLHAFLLVGTTTGHLLACDPESGQIYATIQSASTAITKIILTHHSDSKLPEIWTSSNDSELRIWTLKFDLLATIPWVGKHSKVRSLLSIAQHVWAANFRGEILIFDGVRHHALQEVPSPPGSEDEITALIFLAPRTMLAACRSNQLRKYQYHLPPTLALIPPRQIISHVTSPLALKPKRKFSVLSKLKSSKK